MCSRLCRVLFLGHTANTPFAECRSGNTRQTTSIRQRSFLPCATSKKTRGTWQKWHVCHVPNGKHTARWGALPCATPSGHMAKPLSSSSGRWHSLFFVGQRITRQRLCCVLKKEPTTNVALPAGVCVSTSPCVAHDKAFTVCFRGFAVCLWHTANMGIL